MTYSTSMPFATQSDSLILDSKINSELNEFWHNKELGFEVTEDTTIISFACQIPNIDPLACLKKFGSNNTLHFYWENCSKQEAVVAWGVARSNYAESDSRFSQARDFSQSCFRQIIRKGASNLAIGKPSVFCSFTFFAETKESEPFKSGTLFLPRFQIVKKNKNHCLIINYPLKKGQDKNSLVQQLKQKTSSIDWTILEDSKLDSNNLVSVDRDRIQDSEYFKSVVKSVLNSIASDEISKIVVAHTTDIRSATSFRVVESLSNLRQLHPDCYIFSTSNGKGQSFVGASPERLISVQNCQLVTDALAGSAPRGSNSTEDLHLANSLLKNRKEKREHQAVKDFTIERLRSIGLKPQQLPLQILKLSNIQHLWTPIYAQLPPDIKPLEIVELLHPTPAVAGVSTQAACEKISDYEKFDRSLYAAPLGWVDSEGNCEFIVGIRSALIDGNRARLYAGAGIVSGSNPDKEFDEVQLKIQSLLKALV